jgi:hypothetical protein
MMYMCASRFEINEEERIMLSEYLSAQEIQVAKEERTQQQITVDPISDDEEDEGLSTEFRATSQLREISHAPATSHGPAASQGPSANSLGKRRLVNIAEDVESNQEDDREVTSLPDMQHRVSGRVRKRSRLLDEYET